GEGGAANGIADRPKREGAPTTGRGRAGGSERAIGHPLVGYHRFSNEAKGPLRARLDVGGARDGHTELQIPFGGGLRLRIIVGLLEDEDPGRCAVGGDQQQAIVDSGILPRDLYDEWDRQPASIRGPHYGLVGELRQGEFRTTGGRWRRGRRPR